MSIVKYTEKLYGLLPLTRKIVGVKLVEDEQAFRIYDAKELNRGIPYCVAVKSAMAGHSIKINHSTSTCSGGNRALGLVAPCADYLGGERGVEMGLCRDHSIARGIVESAPIKETSTYGVIIKPLEDFEDSPDVVLLTTYARNMMRLFQGYTYHYGMANNLMLTGNQAVCVESTVNPLVNQGINLSVLCSGTRHNARWQEDELMAGISFNKFVGVVDGIEMTVNPVEPDENKKRIEKSLKETNNLSIEVAYGKTYYHTKADK